jgi:hypothetical protein
MSSTHVVTCLTRRLLGSPILRNDVRGEVVEEVVAMALEEWALCATAAVGDRCVPVTRISGCSTWSLKGTFHRNSRSRSRRSAPSFPRSSSPVLRQRLARPRPGSRANSTERLDRCPGAGG